MRIPEENVDAPVSLSLTPYTGSWTAAQAANLLRRTIFGPTYQQIQDAVADGMNAVVAQLLTLPVTNPPLTYHPDEAVGAQGQPWLTELYPASNPGPTQTARGLSLAAWTMERLNNPVISIQEKMCLFWDNHFGVEMTGDPKAVYNLHNLYRVNCLGDFRQLVKDVTIDVNMLIFLNGTTNNQFFPNENYARELLELFTVGKGLQIGEGDYTNYTEGDVAAGAKILTGWIVQDLLSSTEPSPSSVFSGVLHDNSTKTLSAHFGNASIPAAGDQEYSNYIDIIFQQPNMAKFICRKLYRWFVNYDLTQDVEDTVIADMAATLEANDFVILPVMEELLKSEHFYDVAVRGAIIKNPAEYLFAMLNSTHSRPSFDLETDYEMYLNMYNFMAVLGMDYYTPPSVGGWTAYYQAPSFSRLWANASYIKLRFDLGAYLTVFTGLTVNGHNFKLHCLEFLDGLSVPSDPVQVIDDIVLVFCPKGLTNTQKLTLKFILTNGLPDFEWTVQYNEYIADPTNPTVSDPVRTRVELVLYRLFQMAEVQTL